MHQETAQTTSMAPTTEKSICLGRIITEYISDHPAESIESVTSWSRFPGGSAANVAFGLAKLACPVSFMGCVGDDESGERLIDSLKNSGIDASAVRRSTVAQTGWLWTLRDKDGQSTYHSPEGSYEFFADTQFSSFDIAHDSFEGCKFFIPQAAYLGPDKSREAIFAAREIATTYKLATVFDVNFRPFAWNDQLEAKRVTRHFCEQSDFLKFSQEEADWLCGARTAQELERQFPKARGILLTLGGNGSDFILDGNRGLAQSFQVTLLDSTGAGDAFLAAFVSRLAIFGLDSLKSIDRCKEFVQFANAAGAICVSKLGAVNSLPDEQEILQFMEAMRASPGH
jgi:fructokinase